MNVFSLSDTSRITVQTWMRGELIPHQIHTETPTQPPVVDPDTELLVVPIGLGTDSAKRIIYTVSFFKMVAINRSWKENFPNFRLQRRTYQ